MDISNSMLEGMGQQQNQLMREAAEAKRIRENAARFVYLQNIDPSKAQAFFWNYTSRKEREKAIDLAMLEARK